MREPFVDEGQRTAAPKGRRLRYAVGELLTCTRCLGTWSSLGLVGLRVARPREARVLAAVLAAAALNDLAADRASRCSAPSNTASRRSPSSHVERRPRPAADARGDRASAR